MRIKRISMKDFRGIDSLDIDLVDPGGNPLDLAVFAGPNGCGKTAVLEACLLALGRGDLVGERAASKGNVSVGKQRCDIGLLVKDGGADRGLSCSQEVSSRRENGMGKTSRLPGEEEDRIQYFSSWRWPKLVGSVSVSAGKKGKRPTRTEENRLWIIKQFFVNLRARKAFLDSNQNLVGQQEGDYLAKFNQAWKLFYPETKEHWDAVVAGERVEEGFEFGLVRSESRELIPVDWLSSGEIEVASMLGWNVIQRPQPEILLIDEPELHLHPSWHRVLLRALRTVLPDTQILCATHSMEILESVYSEQRFTLLPADDPRLTEWAGRVGGDAE